MGQGGWAGVSINTKNQLPRGVQSSSQVGTRGGGGGVVGSASTSRINYMEGFKVLVREGVRSTLTSSGNYLKKYRAVARYVRCEVGWTWVVVWWWREGWSCI